jgi:hypothetical protein
MKSWPKCRDVGAVDSGGQQAGVVHAARTKQCLARSAAAGDGRAGRSGRWVKVLGARGPHGASQSRERALATWRQRERLAQMVRKSAAEREASAS